MFLELSLVGLVKAFLRLYECCLWTSSLEIFSRTQKFKAELGTGLNSAFEKPVFDSITRSFYPGIFQVSI